MYYGFINNPTAWVIILVVVVVLFGGKNIPELMKGLGQGMRAFKHGMETDEEPRHAEEEREAARRAKIEEEVRSRLEAERRQNRESAETREGSP